MFFYHNFLQHTFSTTYIYYAVSTLEWFPWFSCRDFTEKKCQTLESEVPTSLRAGKGPKGELSNWNPEVPLKDWPQWMTSVDLNTWESVQYAVRCWIWIINHAVGVSHLYQVSILDATVPYLNSRAWQSNGYPGNELWGRWVTVSKLKITAQSIAPWRLVCCTLWSWVEGAAAE